MSTNINMKKASWGIDSDGFSLRLYPAEPSDENAAKAFLEGMNPEKHYAAVVGEVRKKRSLDANSYAWVLLNKLSESMNLPAVEIYQNMIRDIGGVSEIIPVRNDAAERWCSIWSARGEGWQCEKLDGASLPGYTMYQCWYGSSVYDTKKMSRLIDLIVQECAQQGIETMTPDELAKLKGLTDEE